MKSPTCEQHGLNDRITSIEVDGNQAWEVCRDVNFGGGCRVFQRHDRRPAPGRVERSHFVDARRRASRAADGRQCRGWGNRRQYARQRKRSRRVSRDWCSSIVRTFAAIRATCMNSATNLGSIGDSARSVQVYGGTWELCEGASRNARCVTVSRGRAGSAEPRTAKRRHVGARGRKSEPWWQWWQIS